MLILNSPKILLKVVLDTSVFIAAFLSSSPQSSSAQIIAAWKRNEFTLIMAPQLLEELTIKLLRKNIPNSEIEILIKTIIYTSIHIPGIYSATKLDNIDPNDNMFLAAAYESGADYLVSLDKKHLLPLKYYHGTQIVTPDLFRRILNRDLNAG